MKPLYFLNLDRQLKQIKPELFKAITKVYEDSAFSGGKYTEQFENEFAQFCKVKYCSGVNSGTAALHLALLALNIGSGDEVLVPANTFIATAAAVSHTGAKPVFVDCDSKTWNIDSSDIEHRINKKTKAIIGVHLYGQPFNIDAVANIAKKHQLKFIEDCAQAQGALYKHKKVGSFSDMACFSFYPGKNLGALGEAGAVVTNSFEYKQRLDLLRNHGSVQKYYHEEVGYNYRMDGIQAAALSVKLKHLALWNQKRQTIASTYQKEINNPLINIQQKEPGAESVYHLYVITTEYRDKLKEHLEAQGIFAGMHYPVPCHLQKAYTNLGYKTGDFPQSEYLASHCLSLPMFPEMTPGETKRVIDAVNQFKLHEI